MMDIVIQSDGSVRCVYGESINLACLGRLTIERGSHVEPDEQGLWMADLEPVDGPRLGPFENRSQALQAETEWLVQHWLPQQATG